MKSPEELADEVIEACNLNACSCRATRGCRGTIIGAITEYGEALAAHRATPLVGDEELGVAIRRAIRLDNGWSRQHGTRDLADAILRIIDEHLGRGGR